MTKREKIIYRVLLVGVIVGTPLWVVSVVFGPGPTQAMLMTGYIVWFFTFWYWEGLKREKERLAR